MRGERDGLVGKGRDGTGWSNERGRGGVIEGKVEKEG